MPGSIETLRPAFAGLPSVGPVAAERLAFHVVAMSPKDAAALADALSALQEGITACARCGNASVGALCAACGDERRDRTTLLVVESIEHIALFEKTRKYAGLYHVLGAVPKKSPADAPGIERLAERLRGGGFREVVLALSPTPAGDAAAAEIARRAAGSGVTVTRIGRGVPPGGTFGASDARAVAESIECRAEAEIANAAPDEKYTVYQKVSDSAIPPQIEAVVGEIRKLPGIGAQGAARIAFHLALVAMGKSAAVERDSAAGQGADARTLASVIRRVKSELKKCGVCGGAGDTNPCEVCSDRTRDAALLCVVATAQDALRIESTGAYRGRYHVLGGLFSPLDCVAADDLDLKGLEKRLRAGGVREVVIATDPTFAGDGTALLVRDVAARYEGVKITRIGRGVLRGGDLGYASPLQLENALASRKRLEACD